MELEDATEEEHKSLQTKVESLESIVRMLELKAKNSSDHGGFGNRSWEIFRDLKLF